MVVRNIFNKVSYVTAKASAYAVKMIYVETFRNFVIYAADC